jgi:hypothetical protein
MEPPMSEEAIDRGLDYFLWFMVFASGSVVAWILLARLI